MGTNVPEGYKPGDPLTYGAFAGVRNDTQAERMSIADLTLGQNVDIDNSLQVARRRGRRALQAGVAHSLWSNGEVCFYVLDNTLYRLLPDLATSVLIRSGITANLELAYGSPGNGLIYWSNGIESGVIEADQSRPWGIPAPEWPALFAGPGGMLRPGRYQAVLASEAADGRESGGSPAATVTLPNGGGIRIQFAPSTYATNLYLSPMDGDELYWAAQIPAGVGDYVFAGSEQDYGRAFDKRHLIDCPGGHLIGWHGGRLYVAQDGLIYPSQPLAYELFDPYDVIEPDGSRITLFAPVLDGIFIGTERRITFYRGTGPDDFKPADVAPGGALPGSLAYAKGDEVLDGQIFGKYATPIFSTSRGLVAGTQDGQLIPLSGPRYRHGAASRATAVIRRDVGFQQYLAVLV